MITMTLATARVLLNPAEGSDKQGWDDPVSPPVSGAGGARHTLIARKTLVLIEKMRVQLSGCS
jgi:hypothetical protein